MRTDLTFNAATCTWIPSSTFSLPNAAGAIRVDLEWGTGNGNSFNGTPFTDVQGTYSGDDTVSGPVKVVELWEGGGPTTPSFATGSSHNVTVRVGVLQNLKNAQSTSDPLVTLKLGGGGSRQHSIDCEPGTNLQQQLSTGCHPTYRIDRPPATNPAVDCPATYPNKAVLFASSNATGWPCVGIQTGGTTGQVRQGMTNRILAGGTCAQHPNNWASFPNFSPGDTRILPLFLTAFGAFSGNGNSTTVPVTDFATFYVTGFGVCAGDDTTPGNGYIVGHFIKYIAAPGSGGGTLGCDVTSFGSCVTVLTQ
jgi:hypothetical protein